MQLRLKLIAAGVAAAVAAAVTVALAGPGTAIAHGALLTPGSRTYLCYVDGLISTGEIQPTNGACQNALDVGGTQPFYDWFGVLRSDGAGRTRGFIPDGALCSGGFTKFAGFDAPRTDWPLTHLTSGADWGFRYSNWATHPGWFYLYVTKDGYDPAVALTWDDLEEEPFAEIDHPPSSGPAPDGYYYWDADLPAGKTGQHLIYSVWQRSDSNETFYGCSDVVFDGGNGEVTGIRGNPTPPPTPTPTGSPTPTPSPTATTPAPSDDCAASYTLINEWPDGFQGEVTVTNTGSTTLNGWLVTLTFPDGQTVQHYWSSRHEQSGATESFRNESWNGSLAADASTAFGFLGAWTGSNNPPTVYCST